jgi:hypothetical protein
MTRRRRQFDASFKLEARFARLRNLFTFFEAGVNQRIDENRMFAEMLQRDAAVFLAAHPWVVQTAAITGQIPVRDRKGTATSTRPAVSAGSGRRRTAGAPSGAGRYGQA